MGVRASVIRRRGDGHAESFDRVKSTAERKVNFNFVLAASVETEDRDSEFATLGIEITSRFQIRPCITGLDRPCGRSRFWENPELGELEARYIINAGVDETDEWRGPSDTSRFPTTICPASAVMVRTHSTAAT